jgi:nucleoside-diphosphate-sugar epimerase
MTTFVTGGTGFLGRRLVARLLAEGDRVRCLVRPSADATALRAGLVTDARGRLQLVPGSLAAPNSYATALAGCDRVYHLAAEMRGATAILFLTNVVGTRALLAAAARAGVHQFVLISSLSVYDGGRLHPGDTVHEEYPLDPHPHLRDPYTYSKVVQETAAWQAQAAGLPVTVVRPGVIYGPGRDCLSGRVGLRFGRLVLAMGGRQPLPYTHVENCADAVALAGRPAAIGSAVNVVDDELPTGWDLVREHRRSVGGIRGVRIPARLVPVLSGLCEWYHVKSRGQVPAVLTRYKSRAMWTPVRYSNARAKSVLGWRPARSLAEGLRESFEWLARHRHAAGRLGD